MFTTSQVDITIVGAGMTGLSAALALEKQGFSVALVYQKAPEPLLNTPSLRVSAINAASLDFLNQLGMAQSMQLDRLAPYQQMQVWRDEGLGGLGFNAADIGLSNIGTIIENDHITYALWQQVKRSNIVLKSGRASQLACRENAVIQMENGDCIFSQLIIGADGANSWVRTKAHIPLSSKDYNHHALVATLATEQPHNDTAYQSFLATGPLAILPLYEPNLTSMVWSAPAEDISKLAALSKEALGKKISAAYQGRLGRITLQSECATFPLKARFARDFIAHRIALVGDSAHTIHPLAGQGVNLGFADVMELVKTVSRAKRLQLDIGDKRVLAPYNRVRKTEALAMQALMRGIKVAFDAPTALTGPLLDGALWCANTLPGIKGLLTKGALGKN